MVEDQYFNQAGNAAVIPPCRGLSCGLDFRIHAQCHRRGLDLRASAGHELSSLVAVGAEVRECTAVCSAQRPTYRACQLGDGSPPSMLYIITVPKGQDHYRLVSFMLGLLPQRCVAT